MSIANTIIIWIIFMAIDAKLKKLADIIFKNIKRVP
jgi:hypothetical protein